MRGKVRATTYHYKVLQHRILSPTNSPCNTPILPIKKKHGSCLLVQDLRMINEAVIPLHSIIPNTYVLLRTIPPEVHWFSTLDLKDPFFCIPLH